MPSPRIAIIGLGAFGQFHAQCLPAGHLTAVVEPDEGRRAGAVFPGVAAFASLPELIRAGVADAVVIATRSDTHAPLALEAMAAGLDVLIEKPAAESEEELEALIKAAHKHQRVAMVNHICLFHSLISPILERVRASGFRAVHCVRHRPSELARRFREAHPLSLLMVHDLSVIAEMVGGEEPSDFSLLESRGATGQVDMAWATLRWADGRVATLQAHCTLPACAPADGWDRMELFGDDLHSVIQTNPAPWQWQQGEKPLWPVALEISTVQGRPVGMLVEAQRSFIAATQGAAIPGGCTLGDALRLERWMARLRQSVR